MIIQDTYNEFLTSKKKAAEKYGFDIALEDVAASINNPLEHQPVIVQWALNQGRALLGLQFGLTKTVIQCALAKIVWGKYGDPFSNQKCLIVCPLGVKSFFEEDASYVGINLQYCTTDDEMDAADTPFIITNYERVRDGCELNADYFDCSVYYAKEIEQKKTVPTLFDCIETEKAV